MRVYTAYPAAYHHLDGSGLYQDIANHCENWAYFGQGDKLTAAHEATHGINAQLRNANGTRRNVYVSHDCKPLKAGLEWHVTNEAVGGFYCLNSHAAIVTEPACKKDDAIPFVPKSLHGPRWELYMIGQSEWNDEPLYIMDEWSAYVNQAFVGIDLYNHGEKVGLDQDTLMGAIEFIPYGIGVLMAADKANSLSPQLIEFAKVMLRRACNVYHLGRSIYLWQGQDELWQAIATGADAAPLRQFLASRLSFLLPGWPVPEEGLT